MCLRGMLFVAKSICLNHSESVDATAKLEHRSKDYSGHLRKDVPTKKKSSQSLMQKKQMAPCLKKGGKLETQLQRRAT